MMNRNNLEHQATSGLSIHDRIFSGLGKSCWIVGLLLAVGCGSGDRGLVPVEGQVTIDGKPITSGRIEFFPESGRPAIGNIDSEGRYQLQTYEPGDGAKPGNYRVAITSQLIPEEVPQYNSLEDEMRGNVSEAAKAQRSVGSSSRMTWVVPKRYSNRTSSDLNAVVSKDAKNVDFQLTTKP